uniref:Abhydrolase domain containing 5, lysophosphatidic acid acyltransferase n=1 Tax=Myripristis murdjan TaxID=586833 RepID=A0A667ZI39_9TELE
FCAEKNGLYDYKDYGCVFIFSFLCRSLWIPSWLPSWCPTSENQLKMAEDRMLQCKNQGCPYVPISGGNLLWTLTFNTDGVKGKTPVVLLHGFGCGVVCGHVFLNNGDFFFSFCVLCTGIVQLCSVQLVHLLHLDQLVVD